MGEHPKDLHKLFMIDDDTVFVREQLHQMGLTLRQGLAAGAQGFQLELNAKTAAHLANILIIDDGG
jgi:hypothetical protein